MSNHTSNSCCVYVIQSQSGAVKIGIATDVSARLSELQTGNHETLTAVYRLEVENRQKALALESLLHQRYANTSMRGEWFRVNAEQLIADMRFVLAVAGILTGASFEVIPLDAHPRSEAHEGLTRAEYWKLLTKALRKIRDSNKASVGVLVNKLGIDESLAQELISDMLQRGIIRPLVDGASAHELIPADEWYEQLMADWGK